MTIPRKRGTPTMLNMPGFRAEASLYEMKAAYNVSWGFDQRKTGVRPQQICDSYKACYIDPGYDNCVNALCRCRYYHPFGGGSDPSNCCRWYVERCLGGPPGSGGGGGGAGGSWKPPHGHLPE